MFRQSSYNETYFYIVKLRDNRHIIKISIKIYRQTVKKIEMLFSNGTALTIDKQYHEMQPRVHDMEFPFDDYSANVRCGPRYIGGTRESKKNTHILTSLSFHT